MTAGPPESSPQDGLPLFRFAIGSSGTWNEDTDDFDWHIQRE